MSAINRTDNLCLDYGCSECCNPVKINSWIIINARRELPFVDLNEIFIPEQHPDSVRLKTYKCHFFNPSTGLCDNYANRPNICRNTECFAFQIADKKKRLELIKFIQSEKFIKVLI